MPISATDIAAATEVLNRLTNLSPAARRVGLELLGRVDRRTGLAWPSEKRMAEALGYDARSIRRGKAELAAAGILTWQQRGTSRKGRTPLYQFLWSRLRDLAFTLKKSIQDACTKARAALRAVPVKLGRTFRAAYPLKVIPRVNDRQRSQATLDVQNAIYSHPNVEKFSASITTELENEAIKAEQASPAHGLTGLAFLIAALEGRAIA